MLAHSTDECAMMCNEYSINKKKISLFVRVCCAMKKTKTKNTET